MATSSGEELQRRMKWYQATALFSIFFAVLGFTYNVWRMEITEHNSNVREASCETLLQLAELEQLVFAAHYDQDPVAGNPRNGWAKGAWGANRSELPTGRSAAESVVSAIDFTRKEVLDGLTMLD